MEAVTDFIFLSSQITALVTAAMKLKGTLKEGYDKPRQHIKKQRHNFADKGPLSQSYGFSSSHIWMWEFDHIDVSLLIDKEWILLNCDAEKELWESIGQQGD